MSAITLVIPGRNCEATIRECVRAAARACTHVDQAQILYVDDHSTDASAALAEEAGAIVLSSTGRGAGAARNTGWRAAEHPLVWFVDSDCIAAEDALSCLLPHMDDPSVGAVSGAYDNAVEGSLVTLEFHDRGDETELVLTHERLPSAEITAQHEAGWTGVLGKLASALAR